MAGLFEDAVRIVVTGQDGAKATYEPGMFGRMKTTFADGDVCQVEDPDGGFVIIDIRTGSPDQRWSAHLRSH